MFYLIKKMFLFVFLMLITRVSMGMESGENDPLTFLLVGRPCSGKTSVIDFFLHKYTGEKNLLPIGTEEGGVTSAYFDIRISAGAQHFVTANVKIPTMPHSENYSFSSNENSFEDLRRQIREFSKQAKELHQQIPQIIEIEFHLPLSANCKMPLRFIDFRTPCNAKELSFFDFLPHPSLPSINVMDDPNTIIVLVARQWMVPRRKDRNFEFLKAYVSVREDIKQKAILLMNSTIASGGRTYNGKINSNNEFSFFGTQYRKELTKEIKELLPVPCIMMFDDEPKRIVIQPSAERPSQSIELFRDLANQNNANEM